MILNHFLPELQHFLHHFLTKAYLLIHIAANVILIQYHSHLQPEKKKKKTE